MVRDRYQFPSCVPYIFAFIRMKDLSYTMHSLREFLETSTIHGLSYISSAPSKLSKVFWFLVVVAGFSSAVYLINISYVDWQASPVSTSISTHPIADLPFPTVTVCPPEASNTALNYDLVRAGNITLTEKDRQTLINFTKTMLIDEPSSDFVRLARALINEGNVVELFDRKPKFSNPIPYLDNTDNTRGFEIWSSQLNGSYCTPGFGKGFDCNNTLDNIHFVLQLPLTSMEKSDGATLDIEIEVENHEDWLIQFREGGKYSLQNQVHEKRSWQEAESYCSARNGHLATVGSYVEIQEIDAGQIGPRTWIGGTDMDTEDVWTWVDGTPWPKQKCNEIVAESRAWSPAWSQPCTQWEKNNPSGGTTRNCLAVSQSFFYSERCSLRKDFICRFNPTTLDSNKTIALKLKDVTFDKVEFWLKRKIRPSAHTCDVSQRMPGFSLNWVTKQEKSGATNEGVYDALGKMKGKYKAKQTTVKKYQTFVANSVRYGIVRKARSYNMTDLEIWDVVTSWKKEALHEKLFTCVSNVMSTEFFGRVIGGLGKKISSDRATVENTETKEDLFLAFDIFSYLTFCQNEAMEVQVFFENLLSTGSPQTILQATMNNLKLNYQEQTSEIALKHIYKQLNILMDLKLSDILVAIHGSGIAEATRISEDDVLVSSSTTSQLNQTTMRAAARVSNHPLAMWGKDGKISPSALVPFCSFGSQMIGAQVSNMTFPMCDVFEPTVYDGQLCYQADVKKHPGQKVFEGKESGLMLLIDVNAERSVNFATSGEDENVNMSKRRVYLGTEKVLNSTFASLHIGTLAHQVVYGPGDYSLTSIKQMTGTDNFLAWPQERRKCTLETYEKCQMRDFHEKSVKCSCSPFQLIAASGVNDQVNVLCKVHGSTRPTAAGPQH